MEIIQTENDLNIFIHIEERLKNDFITCDEYKLKDLLDETAKMFYEKVEKCEIIYKETSQYKRINKSIKDSKERDKRLKEYTNKNMADLLFNAINI